MRRGFKWEFGFIGATFTLGASWGIKFASTGLRVLEVEDLGFRVSWGLEREVL